MLFNELLHNRFCEQAGVSGWRKASHMGAARWDIGRERYSRGRSTIFVVND